MTTDLELLVMAAKAAAFEVIGNDAVRGVLIYADSQEIWWNPLADDGDALRLAVKLKLHLGLETATVSAWESDKFGNFQTEILRHHGDEAATRRAIVRAAAEVGRNM